MNHAVRLHVQGHDVWTLVSATCFPVRLCKTWVPECYFCTDCHNKYVMPILMVHSYVLKCVHTQSRILKSLQFHTVYTLRVYNYFYLIFTILCDDHVVYLFVYL